MDQIEASGVIKADDRHTARRIKKGVQGDVIRALVELITNSDDSYINLEDDGKLNGKGVIEVHYSKVGNCGTFIVRDYAEGMTVEDVKRGFTKYGAPTSGFKNGARVRGYFGQGAKDALASMINGKIATFKNGYFTECELYLERGLTPRFKLRGNIQIEPALRQKYLIPENGTVAFFEAEKNKTGRSVPRFNTIHEELANNYLLRKIMQNPKRKVILFNDNTGEKIPLGYNDPIGEEVLKEDFSLPFDSYGDFPIHIVINRSQNRELEQSGDNREGGLLLIDELDAVMDISLFGYDNIPDAARLFGEVKIEKFRTLLINEEPVLSEERDGIDRRHLFCELLIKEIEKRLEKVVKEERLRKRKKAQKKIDLEELRRYKKAFRILNKIAEIEVKDAINLGHEVTDNIPDPPNGFCIYPSNATINVGKRYKFELQVNTKIVRYGSTIKVKCSDDLIRVVTSDFKITREDGVGIIKKYITVIGMQANIEGILIAETGERKTEAKISVILEEKDLFLDEGLYFEPATLTLRPNKSRRVTLYVYTRKVPGGSTIKVYSENDAIKISKDQITVNEFDAERHVAKYEMSVWGEGVGQEALITAAFEDCRAFIQVKIKSKKEEEEDKSRKGMFNEPIFDYDVEEPTQRTRYNSDTGEVIIYGNFPSVKHYLGENGKYKKALHAQVFIADLVVERCFYAIAEKYVDTSGVVITKEGKTDRIQRDANELSKKHGHKVHEALVDQKALEEAKDQIEESSEE